MTNGKYVHAKDLIEEREQKEYVFHWSGEYAKAGDIEKLNDLFKTPYGKIYAKQDGGYKGVYKQTICMFHMAKNEDEMQKAFDYISGKGFQNHKSQIIPNHKSYQITNHNKSYLYIFIVY